MVYTYYDVFFLVLSVYTRISFYIALVVYINIDIFTQHVAAVTCGARNLNAKATALPRC